MMQLKVKYLFPNMPELISADGDSGYDIRAAIDKPLIISAGERATVPTGIAVEIANAPAGLSSISAELQVRPRSGQTRRGLVAQFGTIDASYRGEIWVTLFNVSKEDITIEPLARIAQIVVCPIFKPTITTAKELTATARGANGFGSTGDK